MRKALPVTAGRPSQQDSMCGIGGLLFGSIHLIKEKKLSYDAYGSPSVSETGKQTTFEAMEEASYLDTTELMALFGISRSTLARYLSQHGLKPSVKCDRKLFFLKRDVEHWRQATQGKKDKWPLQAVGRVTRAPSQGLGVLASSPGSGKTTHILAPIWAALLLQNSEVRTSLENIRDSLNEALGENCER